MHCCQVFSKGKIAYTGSRSLSGVGVSKNEWENLMKNLPAGKSHRQSISDDTVPGGPIQREIEYLAPFTRCDREKDYEIAWKFFEKKYGK